MITSSTTRITYKIENSIAEGAFGIVYACTDEWNNRLVAKVLKPENVPPEAHEQRVLKELNALLLVRHPNVIHVFDAFALKGTYYIITERCDQTLGDLLKLANFTPGVWFLPIARCLLQAVHFVHVQNLAHCDIHLGNVFVRFVPDELLPNEHAASTFKLGDFGLAKVVSSVSAEGTFLNSIRPPEAINPDEFGPIDHRVDVFQIGLILLQILHGHRIEFDQAQILDGVPRKLAENLNSPEGDALARMLRRHVSARTFTALQAWLDLKDSNS